MMYNKNDVCPWSWEICLAHNCLSEHKSGDTTLYHYDKQDFNYYGALNLAMITSRYLPFVESVSQDQSYNLLTIHVNKQMPFSEIEKLGDVICVSSDDPVQIFAEILTQETSCFSLRAIDEEKNRMYITWFHELKSVDSEEITKSAVHAVRVGDACLNFRYSHCETYEVAIPDDTYIGSKIYNYPVLGDFSKLVQNNMSEDQLLETLKGGLQYDTIDTHSLAMRMSSLSSDEVFSEALFEKTRIEVLDYLIEQEQAEAPGDGDFIGFADIKHAEKKIAKNRKRNKLARKAKARQRKKVKSKR